MDKRTFWLAYKQDQSSDLGLKTKVMGSAPLPHPCYLAETLHHQPNPAKHHRMILDPVKFRVALPAANPLDNPIRDLSAARLV